MHSRVWMHFVCIDVIEEKRCLLQLLILKDQPLQLHQGCNIFAISRRYERFLGVAPVWEVSYCVPLKSRGTTTLPRKLSGSSGGYPTKRSRK